MDSDEAFDYFIEVSEEKSDDSDTDKENILKPVKSKRIKNTKKEQFNLIRSFVKGMLIFSSFCRSRCSKVQLKYSFFN